MTNCQTGIASRTTLFLIFGVSAFLVAAIMLLPKGFSDDLSKIGQGTGVVVLVHDKSSMSSLNIMTMLNNVRSDYTGKVEFIVVNLSSNKGRVFSQQQNVNTFALVFFSPNGTRRGLLVNIKAESELRSELDRLSL